MMRCVQVLRNGARLLQLLTEKLTKSIFADTSHKGAGPAQASYIERYIRNLTAGIHGEMLCPHQRILLAVRDKIDQRFSYRKYIDMFHILHLSLFCHAVVYVHLLLIYSLLHSEWEAW